MVSEKMFYYMDENRSKVLWDLFIAIVSFGLTYLISMMTLASKFKKKNSTFQIFSHLHAFSH